MTSDRGSAYTDHDEIVQGLRQLGIGGLVEIARRAPDGPGSEVKVAGRHARWGKRGKYSLSDKGDRVVFSIFGEHEGLDEIGLIAWILGEPDPQSRKSRLAAFDWCRSEMGLGQGPVGREESARERLRRETARRQRKVAAAKADREFRDWMGAQVDRLWGSLQELPGGESHPYLAARRIAPTRDVRILADPITYWRRPDDERPMTVRPPAVVFAVRDGRRPGVRGGLSAIQVVPLEATDHARRRRDRDGEKVAKLTLGIASGAAIKTAPADRRLAVVEGPENAWSVAAVSGRVPIWGIPGSGNLGRFRWPEGVEELWVFGDDDEAGRKGGEALASRAREAGLTVRVLYGAGARDWNDMLQERGPEGLRAYIRSQITSSAENVGRIEPPEQEVRGGLPEPTADYSPDHSPPGPPAEPPQDPPEDGGDGGFIGGPFRSGSHAIWAAAVAEYLERVRGREVIWDQGYFQSYSDEALRWEVINEFAIYDAICQRLDGQPYGKNKTIELSWNLITSIQKNLIHQLAAPGFFDTMVPGLNTRSGFVTFTADGTPSLEPHSPEHRRRDLIDAEWLDPSAIEPEHNPPLFERLMTGAFATPERAEVARMVLGEIAAAACLGLATRLREPKAAVLLGESADNGKSAIIKLIRKLLPSDVVSAVPPAKMSDDRYIPKLAGAQLNLAGELSDQAIKSDVLKMAVTGDELSGREVQKQAVTFEPIAQHIFSTNRVPRFEEGVDRGVLRRLLVIPFDRSIPKEEQVASIADVIWSDPAERALVLSWVIEGARRLFANGLRFTDSEALREALLEVREQEEDPFEVFVTTWITDTPVEVVGGGEAVLWSHQIWNAFAVWAKHNSYSVDRRRDHSRLTRTMVAHYGKGERRHYPGGKDSKCWPGLRVKPGYDESDDVQRPWL